MTTVFYQCHIQCVHLKGRLPSNHQGENKTYSTQHAWIIHITISKLSSFTPLEKQTNKQMRAPRGEWWITLTASYITFCQTSKYYKHRHKQWGLNSVYSGETVNIFLWVKNLHSLDLLLHNDWSEHCFHKRRWTEPRLYENSLVLIWAVLQETVVLHLCRPSLETKEAEEIREDGLTGKAASLVTIMWYSSEPSLLQKEIGLSCRLPPTFPIMAGRWNISFEREF